MVRTVCCLFVMLAAGVAQSAPPAKLVATTSQPRVRFLSLAEARAIALENGHFHQPSLLFPGVGLDNHIVVPQASPPLSSNSFRVLAHPTPKAKGILVTGIDAGVSRNELERNVNQMLLNVEIAYWNLYGSYWQLYSREQALRFAYQTWKSVGAKYKEGKASLADFAQAQGQYELFRSQRLQALDTALDKDRQLRAMLGLPIDNSVRLVPSDAPTLVEKRPDWRQGWEVAKNRPELRMAREDIKSAQINLLMVEKVLVPALHVCGVEDGHSVRDGGVTAADYRPEEACGVRMARLQLARASVVLQDQELKAERFLGLYYRRMSSGYAQIKAARAQREAFAAQLRLRYEKYRAGAQDATLDLLLEAQRFWADALATEYNAITTYNNALAGWEYGKGNILAHAHVTLTEESPCGCDKVRAVVHERKRTRTQVCREPGVVANCPLTAPEAGHVGANDQLVAAPSLPALWKCFPPLRDASALPSPDSEAVRKGGDDDGPLSEWKVSDIFAPHRGHAKQKP